TTAAGELLSAHPAPDGMAPGAPLTLSLRPEALRLSWGSVAAPSDNTLSGHVADSIYLGEIAQHAVDLASGGAATRVKVAQLNPGPTLATAGSAASVTVAPSDVVLLPA
ncbi:MAG: TOBE domain-containing protein, partial [Phycisphaerales bacterium]|nr:TOBE domain-containing protein [Phycisphaerales bacterium]